MLPPGLFPKSDPVLLLVLVKVFVERLTIPRERIFTSHSGTCFTFLGCLPSTMNGGSNDLRLVSTTAAQGGGAGPLLGASTLKFGVDDVKTLTV